MRAGAHEGDAWRGGRVRVGPPAGAHRVGGQALCGSGAWRAPLLTRAFSIPSRARACPDCRGGEAKHAGRVDGGGRGGEGGRGEGAEATAAERASGRRRGQHGARASDGDEGAVRAEERGEATDGGGRRSRKAVTEKAAAGIEWNGGTACKEKGLSPSPSLLEGLTHTPASLLFLGRALPPL